MADFMYEGSYYSGINPAGLTFQRQTDQRSCWAACLCNARSALLQQSDLSDADLLAITHPGYSFVAIHDNEILEAILIVAEKTGVKPCVKTLWKTAEPGVIDGLEAALQKEYPALLALRSPTDGEIGHMVLVLATGGRMGTDWLVYDPAGEGQQLSGGVPRWVRQGGLRVVDYGVLISDPGNWVIPLQKRVAN